MSRESFLQEFAALGCVAEPRNDQFLVFPWLVPIGKFAGRQIRVGLLVGGDAPVNPPPGPHISPHLLPFHPNNDVPHPAGGIHSSPLGPEWQYWSRPIQHWREGDRSARQYLAHLHALFDTQ